MSSTPVTWVCYGRNFVCYSRQVFNDALNTFYLRLYGVGPMVKDYSDNERGNPLPPHGQLFPISSKSSFICSIPQTGYHIPRPLLHQSWSTGWDEKYLNGSTMKDRSDDPSHHERTLLPRSYISLQLHRSDFANGFPGCNGIVLLLVHFVCK